MLTPPRVGAFSLEALLVSSRNGDVYRAKSPQGEALAVRTSSKLTARDPVLRERFLRGARAAIRARSPHLVRIHDVGLDMETGLLWCAMDLVEGETLQTRLKGGALDTGFALSVCTQVSWALGALHGIGVVHRNVKPANVMLSRGRGFELCATLVGMGLVKMSAEAPGEELTSRGAVLGTPTYLAPEALSDSSQADLSADVYSLGVMLYETMYGKLPFAGSSVIDQLVAKTSGMPPMHGGPKPVTDLLAGMLQPDRKDRPTIGQVAEVLESASEDTRTDIRP
jgi:serine/threonine-protein kinase